MSARVLVTGGRAFADRAFVGRALQALHDSLGIEVVIHGDARGADSLARQWAVDHGIQHDPYPAQWDKVDGIAVSALRRHPNGSLYDPHAGWHRNREMVRLSCPTHAVAFPGGRGTDDMCRLLLNAIRCGRALEFIDLRDGRSLAA